MTSKEWVKNELSLSDDCLTIADRVMFNKVLQDLERLEEFEKVLNGHCSKCVNRENNICVGMDAPIHIDTLINCIEMENQELKDTNMKYAKLIDDFQTKNMRLEKALEIIIKKNVNIGLVNVLGSVEQYNQTYVYDNMLNVKWCLTQEEFDLLKRY